MRLGPIPVAACLLAAAGGAAAQNVVNPARLPERLRSFEKRPGEGELRCSVSPVRPTLNYGFRFQAGYAARVPMDQYLGSGHRWSVVTRVTPEEGGTPTYLVSRRRLPEVPKTTVQLQIGGGFFLGEGKYRVEWMLVDEMDRVCRSHWTVQAKRARSERSVRVALAPNQVASFSSWIIGRENQKDDAPPIRLTLLAHAAAASPDRMRMQWWDRALLLGTMGSILERVPTVSVRVVLFNLDQQREIYRSEDFRPAQFRDAALAMEDLELNLVDYRVLQKPRGHIDLLARLIRDELDAPTPSDVVLFLGPLSRHADKMPSGLVEKPAGAIPRFFYFQYRPFLHMPPVLPDTIESAISKLQGKMVAIHSPGEFAKGILALERRPDAPQPGDARGLR